MIKNKRGHLIGIAAFSFVAMLLDLINYRSEFRIVREVVVLLIEFWIFYSFILVLNRFSVNSLSSVLKSILLVTLSVGFTFFLCWVRAIVGEYYGDIVYKNTTEFIIISLSFYLR